MPDTQPHALPPVQQSALARADVILAEAGLPSITTLRDLLAAARTHVLSPAEGQDDVLLAVALVTGIDHALAGLAGPTGAGGPGATLH
jgi:hypothetical protein